MEADSGRRAPFDSYWRPFLALFGLGLVGVAALYPTLGPVARQLAEQPGAPEVPLLQLLLLVNPTLLLLIGVAIGTALAPRLGLRSHLAAWADGRGEAPPLRAELPLTLALGVVAGVLLLLLDVASRPLLGEETATALDALAAEQPRTLLSTLAGMLYGGITEELITRWGFVSLLGWAGWRLLQRGRGAPGAGIMWVAILVAAVLFGAGHLGVVATQLPLTPALVARTVALNAVGGVIYGWLFWRRSLEAAMIAHAVTHVVFTAAAWAGMLPGAG